MIKAFKKIDLEDDAANKVQQNIQNTFESIIRKAILDGVLLKSVSLTAGSDNVINTKLGRPILGWVVIRKRANASVWDTQDSASSRNTTLTLQTSADVEVDLWIF